MSAATTADVRAANRTLLFKLCVVVAIMFGFGFALVPFYNRICAALGLNDIASPDEVVNTQVDTTRNVRVELDTNVRSLGWQFRAVTPIVDVHPGAVTQVVFEVVNTADRPVTGQAIPSYGRPAAAAYFRKLECFCFTQQTLAPGERRQMPVVFVIDPSVPKDMPALTLSYTFFEVEGGRKG